MSWGSVRVVAVREIRQRLRDRGFLLTTVLLLVLIVLPGLVFGGSGGTERYAVGSLGEDSAALVEAADVQAPLFGAQLEITDVEDREQAELLVVEGELDVVVAPDRELIVEDDLQEGLGSLLRSSAVLEEAAGGDAPPEPPSFEVVPLVSETRSQVAGLAALATLLLFLVVYLPSYFVAAGVVEEKASRVVEVILSSVRPRELLAGKVLGLGLLGLAQVVVLLALGVLVGAGSGIVIVSPELAALVVSVLGAFVLGFLFYGFLFAVAGAVVSRQEDLQYSVLAPTAVLFVAFFVAQSQAPTADSSLAQVLGLLPPTAPFMLPVQVASGEAGGLEIALGVVLTLTAIVALAGAAGRLYAGSVLRFGGRVSLGDAWKG
ncbi:MAG: ABC transporter permease [Solirubrobacteraceae bacterium MAG38_C4-C5]|nr:ABC transporter permease [Candidatus Siliceabacter maunaloa]